MASRRDRGDKGTPFASTGIHGLNRLNVWWLQLGIVLQRITRRRPKANGAHERLLKTLKGRATRPPAANLNLQQQVFNRFRVTYNELRPHEALDDERRASRWSPSPRPSPCHFEVRKLSGAGTFLLHSGQHVLSQALNHEYVGFEELANKLWNTVYYDTLFGRFDERTAASPGPTSLGRSVLPISPVLCQPGPRLLSSRPQPVLAAKAEHQQGVSRPEFFDDALKLTELRHGGVASVDGGTVCGNDEHGDGQRASIRTDLKLHAVLLHVRTELDFDEYTPARAVAFKRKISVLIQVLGVTCARRPQPILRQHGGQVPLHRGA